MRSWRRGRAKLDIQEWKAGLDMPPTAVEDSPSGLTLASEESADASAETVDETYEFPVRNSKSLSISSPELEHRELRPVEGRRRAMSEDLRHLPVPAPAPLPTPVNGGESIESKSKSKMEALSVVFEEVGDTLNVAVCWLRNQNIPSPDSSRNFRLQHDRK